MFCVPVRFVTSAVVLATIVAAAVQPSYAAPFSQSEARVLCVNLTGGATGAPCANADAYTTIQAAVDAAQSDNEIRIAKGVYVESDEPSDGNVVSITQQSLKLVGGFDPSNWTVPGQASDTVIDGQNVYRGLKVRAENAEFAYLTITRGRAKNDGSYDAGHGGAIFATNASLVLQNVIISDSQASEDGGGIAAGKVTLVDSQIVNNRADGGGGGIRASEVEMLRSTVDSNIAYGIGTLYAFGGGLSVGRVSAIDSAITHNSAKHAGGVGALKAVIERTHIEHNTAVLGGGLFMDGGTLVNSLISNNTASEQGGGLYTYDGVLDVAGTVFSNNVAGIAGDATFFNKAFALLRNITIASTERAPHEAIYAEGGKTLALFDTVVTNHAVGVAFANGSAPYGDYNAFFNNGVNHTIDGAAQPLPFANVVTANPQFVDTAAGNFHLRSSSPLIDAGDPKRDFAILPVRNDPRDIDGEPVPWGERGDIGADEVVGTPRVFAPLAAR